MKYKFGLEVLLKHRKREEEIAQKEFLEAQGQVDMLLAKIEKMWSEISEAREEMTKEQVQGGKKTEWLSNLDAYINGHKLRIEREKVVLRENIMNAEEKRERYIEAAKEHKIIQKLKDKQKIKFKLEVKKKETKALDDLVTTRYKRSL